MTTPRRQKWQLQSACRNVTGDEFLLFETKRGRPSKERPWAKYCDNCPVRQLCFNWAVVHEAEGIWGGMTEKERDGLIQGTSIKADLIIRAQKEGWFENYYEWYPKKWTDDLSFNPSLTEIEPNEVSVELTTPVQLLITFEDLPEPFQILSKEADRPNDLRAVS